MGGVTSSGVTMERLLASRFSFSEAVIWLFEGVFFSSTAGLAVFAVSAFGSALASQAMEAPIAIQLAARRILNFITLGFVSSYKPYELGVDLVTTGVINYQK